MSDYQSENIPVSRPTDSNTVVCQASSSNFSWLNASNGWRQWEIYHIFYIPTIILRYSDIVIVLQMQNNAPNHFKTFASIKSEEKPLALLLLSPTPDDDVHWKNFQTCRLRSVFKCLRYIRRNVAGQWHSQLCYFNFLIEFQFLTSLHKLFNQSKSSGSLYITMKRCKCFFL